MSPKQILVQALERIHSRGGELLPHPIVTHISAARNGIADRLHHCLGRCLAEVVNHHSRAFVGQLQCYSLTDAPTRPSHDRHLALQPAVPNV